MSQTPHQRKSLVDYSKISDRPAQDSRFTAQAQYRKTEPQAAVDPTNDSGTVKKNMSAQMDAVVRLMTGREERSIADKFADSNRPTWEQYKQENHDKLNFDDANQQETERYRRKLDAQRDKLLARRGGGGSPKKKKKSRKHKKRRRRDHSSDESSVDSTGSNSPDENSDDRRRRKKNKKRHKHRKKKRQKQSDADSDSDVGRDDGDEKKSSKNSKNRGEDDGDGESGRVP